MIRSGIITAQGNVDVGRRKRGGNRPMFNGSYSSPLPEWPEYFGYPLLVL